jgi:RimJ/RimL family protein N-acetyltransferase
MITPRTAPQLFALAREPELSRHLQWSAHATMDDSLEYVHDTRALWERGRAWLPGIFDRERAQLVGCTGISSIDRPNRRAEVGTWIGIPFQRSGRNLHAKAAVATVAFELLDLTRLEFLCRVDNEASLESMRRLPGIREEGVLSERIVCDDVAFDAVMFALLKSDFDPAAYPPVELL